MDLFPSPLRIYGRSDCTYPQWDGAFNTSRFLAALRAQRAIPLLFLAHFPLLCPTAYCFPRVVKTTAKNVPGS